METPETPYERETGYAVRYRDTRFHTGTGGRTDRRERAAICELLERAKAECELSADLPWLDMPSGAGRLSTLLPTGDRGEVILIDRDAAMLHAAGAAAQGTQKPARACARAASLPLQDQSVAGVLSMRLFQHIGQSAERIAILTELRRVSTGPLIVSFFDAFSVPHLRRVLRRRWRGRRNTGRSGIRWRTFQSDLTAAGWRPITTRPLSRFWSEQWIVLAK